MNKDIRSVFSANEAKTFGVIKPLHDALILSHWYLTFPLSVL